jgi:hypothetical protein
LAHQGGQFHVAITVALAQTGDHSFAVARGMVLAELELAFDAFDRDFDADDRAQQFPDVILGCIADFPGPGLAGFMVIGERFQLVANPRRVVDHAQVAMHVHHGVIPGRHVPPGLVLAGVPVRADVALRALEHHKHLGTIHRRQLVAAGHVRLQRVAMPLERQMVRRQHALRLHDHGGERIGANQVAQHLAACFAK